LARKKKKAFDVAKEVKAIARERVGVVPAARPIEPKSGRQPKHRKAPAEDTE
jgi:hypothetical protein